MLAPSAFPFRYIAPGVLAGKLPTDESDVYSFGICCWEVFTREYAYYHMDPRDIAAGVIRGELRPTITDGIPRPLAEIMRECWALNPLRRPDFAELAQRLAAMEQGPLVRHRADRA